jgi:hypothetical protein
MPSNTTTLVVVYVLCCSGNQSKKQKTQVSTSCSLLAAISCLPQTTQATTTSHLLMPLQPIATTTTANTFNLLFIVESGGCAYLRDCWSFIGKAFRKMQQQSRK